MKRYLIYILSSLFFVFNTACEDFLDKSPDMGLTDTDVYKDYKSIRGFLDQSYTYLDNYHGFQETNNGRTHIGSISDEFASLFNNAESIPVNNGNWISADITNYEIGISGVNGDKKGTSIWKAYKGLRIVNRVIRDIDKVVNITDDQKKEVLGQAYFLRAWFYFQLIKRYGGMPLMDQLFAGDGSEDLPRKTYHESHDWMVTDLDKAIGMLPDEWDDNNTGRPTKLAAMAVKSMAQLYDASPLMQNDLTKTEVKEYDKERAKIAAQSAYKVIEYIENASQTQYKLMGADETDTQKKLQIYKNIFYWPAPPYTQPEYIWYNRSRTGNFSRYIRSFWLPSELSSGTGNDAVVYNAPTQNMVNMFELQGQDGIYKPIEDPVAHYSGSGNPYENLDPRFKNNILYPGQEWSTDRNGNPMYITTYVDGSMYSTVLSSQHSRQRGQTGYLCKKFIWEQANYEHEAKGGYNLNRVITVYIRTAQIYLDFAEAAFEATGSATKTVDGCNGWTAEMAINKVRNRVGVTDVPSDIVSDPVKFREAYRRERAVELMFENHRWWDIRRWMIAHEIFKEQYPIKGIEFNAGRALVPNKDDVTKDETKNPTGLNFTHKIIDVKQERRIFDMRNYWYPFSMNDVASLNNLVQNPGW